MTAFRPGNYTTFLQIGKNIFKDHLKIITTGNGMKIERVRRRTDTLLFNKFVKYERNFLTLAYLDEAHPQLGGKLKVETNELNFSQFRSHSYTQVGFFTDDRLVFVKFDSNVSYEEGTKFEQVLQSSINSSDIIVRHNYELVDNVFQYRLETNPNLIGKYHEDMSKEQEEISSELVPKLPLTFTEKLFIELGKNH